MISLIISVRHLKFSLTIFNIEAYRHVKIGGLVVNNCAHHDAYIQVIDAFRSL